MSVPNEAPNRTIPQVNALVRALVEQETLGYPFWVGGYVTRCFISDFGHIYFDLNDDDHSISCMVRERTRGTLDFTISNGMDIEVCGPIRVYEKTAKVQIEVEKARLIQRPAYIPDASIIEQLEKKGLWPKTKKPISPSVERIGIVTSKHSEALHDFEDMYRQEGGKASIKPIDVRLQGQQAPREIADAINRLNKEAQVDVIVLTRGGGRSADLAIFNDLLIAEAMCRSSIPIVTGIGHQRDETFADLVADVSTNTPTAAASYLAKLSGAAIPASKSSIAVYVAAAIAILAVAVVVGLFLLNH
jgi:exodeoxyribonuclease VII large subunit